MSNRERWKTVMKYLIGMVILALSMDLALLLPEWYGSWQDSQVMGRTQLSSRENIEFLDTDSLDIAGRMKLLSEVDGDLLFQEYWDLSFDIGNTEAQESHARQILGQCRSEVDRWIRYGLLPKECAEIVSRDESVAYLGSPYLYTEQNAFQVDVFRFMTEDQQNCVTILLDSENSMIYYASFSGESSLNEIADILGFASFEELIEKGMADDGTDTLDPLLAEKETDVSRYDFAAVCGAQEASLGRYHTVLELDVRLEYENFDGYAYRRMMTNDIGTLGFAVMFGTDEWQYIVQSIMASNGYYEDTVDSRELFGYDPAAEKIYEEKNAYSQMNEEAYEADSKK